MEKIIYLAYTLFLFVGAFMGWKKGSSVSLVAGIGSGLMMLLGIWLMSINPRGGHIFLTSVTGVLSVVFLIRLVKTQAFMPSGMLLIITLSVFVFTLLKTLKLNS